MNKVNVVLGSFYGDEGKGKIIDYGIPDYIIPKYDKKEFMVEDIQMECESNN